jgi:transcriptional regulator with XRE-family HTH domain
MQFDEWLDKEITKRGWSRREASRRADISQSMLNKVITGDAQPGLSVYRGIAKAFDMSLVDVLLKAGEVTPNDLADENLNEQFATLPEWQQRLVIKFIENLRQENTDAHSPTLSTSPKSQ